MFGLTSGILKGVAPFSSQESVAQTAFDNSFLDDARKSGDFSSIQSYNNSKDYSRYFEQLLELEAANAQRYIDAERANSESLMKFNADEAAKQRAFAQSSAREEMEFNERMQLASQNFNADEAQKARDHSEYMSSTAFQRATDDLKAAGLNPILAVGAQASTPNSSSATSTPVTGSSVEGSFASGVKANATKSDISSLFSGIAQVYTSMANVSAQLYNTDVMSETQRSSANKGMIASIFNGISSIFGINKIFK